MAYTTKLGGNNITFHEMMQNGFGIVTVMNAKVYDALSAEVYKGKTAYEIANGSHGEPLCTLNTLKIANVPQEGPNKTVTGGQFSNPLIKFGKSARLEMQDALGRAEAIEALGGGIVEYNGEDGSGTITGLHFGEDFVGPKLIIGDSFFIDQKSGQQVNVKIVFYQFLPDSIFNLTQDAEGDATVFDMNGDLLTTVIKVAHKDGEGSPDYYTHGVFYSIVDPSISQNAPIREFADSTAVNKAGDSLVPGQKIKVENVVSTVTKIEQTTTGYTVSYTEDE